MYCIIKCIVQGKQARVKNEDLHHPSCTVVMKKRKSAPPVHNVLTIRQETSRAPCKSGQLQHTGVSHGSFMTRLKALLCMRT